MDTLLLDGKSQLQKAKLDIATDVHKACTAVFYIGDTGLDGKLVISAAGDLHQVISLFVNAGLQSPECRQLLLIAAEHLK